jgi:hypothetical protein
LKTWDVEQKSSQERWNGAVREQGREPAKEVVQQEKQIIHI